MLGFVFFIFGFGTKQKHLGPGQTHTCPHCHNTTQWARIRQYQQFTLFFIPIARWKRRQFEQCGVCGIVAAV
ncbi:zinc-ribbon domain-containing protein [Williamsia muralis]|uniref:Zinc-ribbon domain-containing protein n=1 Tax=Williamsia marianensis TaxID=85044 RepID=A0A2G3PQA1_WILMA|nr:zinc-ribbon domain-containing protein [Williamsia marianensis]PHV67893.1 zinc-ribbon domain-containing protein [Williamsia marianensis]